jgi:hypothetical protein
MHTGACELSKREVILLTDFFDYVSTNRFTSDQRVQCYMAADTLRQYHACMPHVAAICSDVRIYTPIPELCMLSYRKDHS